MNPVPPSTSTSALEIRQRRRAGSNAPMAARGCGSLWSCTHRTGGSIRACARQTAAVPARSPTRRRTPRSESASDRSDWLGRSGSRGAPASSTPFARNARPGRADRRRSRSLPVAANDAGVAQVPRSAQLDDSLHAALHRQLEQAVRIDAAARVVGVDDVAERAEPRQERSSVCAPVSKRTPPAVLRLNVAIVATGQL